MFSGLLANGFLRRRSRLPIFRFGGPFSEQRRSKKRELRHKRQELRKIRDKERATKEKAERREYRKRKKRIDQEIFQLERELRAEEEGRAEDEPVTGALPDFAIIGTMKGGTTFLYHLLSLHPLVEAAAAKEPHFFDFDALFDEGVEWYRQCFPKPRLKDGRMTITGEATPYMANRLAPERMAEVIPQAQLIALLRNPVDRAYSHYHQGVRRGSETRTFEEAIEAKEARSRGERDKMLDDEHHVGVNHRHSSYLSRGVYVDQLQCWSRFFDREQMLVLKSEDFFAHPGETLKVVLDFLGLPEWEPEASNLRSKYSRKKFRGNYLQRMDPATRRRLEEYFEPHNRRLYDFLGKDLGW
jgi:hypothetical protein